MARGNKFERYLNDRDTSSSRSSLSKAINTTGKVLTTAALLGGGYYGLKTIKNSGVIGDLAKEATEGTRLSSTVKNISQKIDYFDAYNTALSQTVKDSGYMRLLSGRAQDDFKVNLVNEFTRVGRGETRKLGGTNTFFEKALLRVRHDRAVIGEEVLSSVRKEKVFGAIDEQFKNHDGSEFITKILKDVVDQESHNKKFMDYTSRNSEGYAQVRSILKQHKVDKKISATSMDEAGEELAGILQSFSLGNKDSTEAFVGKNRQEITTRIKSARQQYDEALIKQSKKSGASSKFIEAMGLKRVTVGDVLNDELFKSSIGINKKDFYKKQKDGTQLYKTATLDPQQILKNIVDDTPDIKNAFVDPMVFKTGSGDIVDLRSFATMPKKAIKGFGERFQVPFVNIKPFNMLGDLLGVGKQDRKMHQVFRNTTIMPTIPDGKSEMDPLKKTYMFFYGRVIDDSGKMIKDDQFLTSATKGPFARIHRAQFGVSSNPKTAIEPTTVAGKVKKALSIGYQEHPSMFKRKSTAISKFWDNEWLPNIYDDLKKGTSYADRAEKNIDQAFKGFKGAVESRTQKLDRDTFELLSPQLRGTLEDETLENLISGERKESVMAAMAELSQRYKSGDRNPADLMYKDEIEKLLNTFMKDPESADSTYRYIRKSKEAALPEVLESIASSRPEVETMLDHAEKVLHAELLNQAEINHNLSGNDKLTIGDVVSKFQSTGATPDQVEAVKNLNLHRKFKSIENNGYDLDGALSKDATDKFLGFIKSPDAASAPVRDDLERVIKQTNPWYGVGPGQSFKNPFEGNQYIVMGESHPIQKINEIIKEGGGVKDIFKAGANTLGLGKDRVGRGNMSQTSTASSLAYFYLFRLNEGISKAGLGLSYKDMGSTQDIAANLFFKRIMAPIAAVSAVSYLNDELGNLTGERPTEGLSRAYANTTVGMQTVKEITGLNTFSRYLERQLPGIDKFKQNPAGIAIKAATFGAIGENKSPIEMREYYTSGVDPVRRGRFWAIGSSTPIYGDRIKYYQPNLYRRIKADPMMTDVMYGSTGEYWSNHWLPNPRNPLGALNPFTWGHWERKHYEDRPYPTSNTGLNEVPLIGPALDATLGRVVKPFRRRPGLKKAHRQYLQEINEKYKHYANKEAGGGNIYMTPGGRLTPVDVQEGYLAGSQSGTPGYSSAQGPAPIGSSTAGMGNARAAVPIQDGQVRIVDPTGGFAPMQSGSYISQSEITAANQGYVDRAYIKTNTDSMSLESLRDNVFVQNLDEAVDPNSAAFRLGETYYSATEMGGIYGFATTLMFGEGNPKGTVLESSSKMTGFNRRFWDMELGGFPGEISEIYRRFIPRHRRAKEYNPFKNKMPEWLPGVEYFKDFKHGDPYTKVAKGEMRLPGAGYESLNKLHPDFFGKYGAIDRYKILADVAPWSEQYKYYSGVVSRMHNAGMIDDQSYKQVQAVRDLVSKQKEKYDFHPYKFKHAEIEKKEVTVLRWLDKDTFITDEYPGNPIRLAGVKMPSKDDEGSIAKKAREILHETVQPGEKITIGIDADPVNRVRDDTVDTMRAVVYNKWGDSVNGILARLSPMFSGLTGKESPVTTNWDDSSATATHALYSSKQITIGKVWEKFAHLDTPFHTKILQIRSPLEMYKREEVYGKGWQSWRNPVRDWVVPTAQKIFERNPINAALHGATAGFLMGAFAGSKGPAAVVGALIGGLGSSARTVGELTKRNITLDRDATWIPKRRLKERAINEYFDKMKYIKYKGLYEKTRQMAIAQEGIDPEAIIARAENKKSSTSYLKTTLDNAKKWLKINKGHAFSDEEEIQSKLNAVNQESNFLDSNREIMHIGPLSKKALEYREQYKTTLYGADPNGDFQRIYRALPKKDRPFFKEFMLAPPEEREEILRLVPKDQKRFYQAKWGLPVDRKGSLTEYFATHSLPGANWDGWKPDYSMEEIKLKFLANEGMEIGEFGFWEDDLRHVQSAPKLSKIKGASLINIADLKAALKGKGIENADIEVQVEMVSEEPGSLLGIDIMMRHDRRQEINETINNNIFDILG